MSTAEHRYIPVKDVAKLVRKALKLAHPETRFSVRSQSYSGGSSIHVVWTDGPPEQDVSVVVKVYQGARFDGTIDLKHYAEHWLRPDGSVLLRHEKGSQIYGGESPEVDNRMFEGLLPDDAEPVHFGADYIFVHRELSNPPPDLPTLDRDPDYDGLPF